MSALRPAMRRGLLRTSRRAYATPATPSSATSATEKVSQAAQQTSQSAKSTALAAATKTSEAASETAARAKEVGSTVASKASETGANATAKASEAGANAIAKAQEAGEQALSKAKDAFAAAGPMAEKLGQSTANIVSKIPGGGDKVVGGVQSMIPHVTYYSKVGLELAKAVGKEQKMTPPSLNTLQTFYAPYYQPLLKPSSYTWLLNPASYGKTISSATNSLQTVIPPPTTIVEAARGISRKQAAEYAVLGAELLGFFTVGTMIGRLKIVGYRGGAPAHH